MTRLLIVISFLLANSVGREPDNSAEWLDARGKFFAQLLRVVTYARGTEVQNKERLWNEFVTGDPDRADRNGQWNLTEQADDTSISNKKKAGQKNRRMERLTPQACPYRS